MKNELLFIVGSAALAFACSSPKAPVQGVETTSAGVVANRDAISRLADARCSHARKCNNLGSDKKYADEAACKGEVRHDLESDLRADECPHGVSEARLNICVTKLTDEKCGNISDKMSRLADCRKGQLCID